MSYDEPKTVTVRRVGCHWDGSLGSAEGTRQAELYIPHQIIKRQKVGRYFSDIALTTFHEIVHTIREEHAPQNNLLERVVAEGIAARGESHMAGELFDAREAAYHAAEYSGEISPEIEERLLGYLLDDAVLESALYEQGYAQDSDEIDEIYSAWFDGQDSFHLGAGAVLGLMAVRRLEDAGCTYSHIVQLPTEDIIGLTSQLAA